MPTKFAVNNSQDQYFSQFQLNILRYKNYNFVSSLQFANFDGQ